MTARRSGARFVAPFLLLGVFASPLGAVDFIRGDCNSDRQVTFADAQFGLLFLFQGSANPECIFACDVNADGQMDISDSIDILKYFFVDGEPPPVAPFPDPGPPQEWDEPAFGLTCETYGSSSPVDMPEAELIIRDAVVPGGDSGPAVITVALTSPVSVAGYHGKLIDEGGVIADADFLGRPPDASGVVDDLSGAATDNGFLAFRASGDTLDFGFLLSLVEPVYIDGGAEDLDVLSIKVCLEPGTPAGEYPLTLAMGELTGPCDRLEEIEPEERCGYGGRSIIPTLVSATLTVQTEVVDTECVVEPDPGPGPDPTEVNVLFKFEEASGAPGSRVSVPFVIRADHPAESFSFSVDFDETMLSAVGVAPLWEKPDGTPFALNFYDFNNDDYEPGSSGIDEGFVTGATVFSLGPPSIALPTDVEVEVIDLEFLIHEDAPPRTTAVHFEDGAGGGPAGPVDNAITVHGETITPDRASSFELVDGFIHVLGGFNIQFKLEDASGVRGSPVSVPFVIRADRRSMGFSFSVDFDETALRVTGAERLWEKPDGTPYEFEVYEYNNNDNRPGNTGVDEGYVVGAAIISLTDTPNVLPPSLDVPVLQLNFFIYEHAPIGTTQLRFMDGGLGSGGPVENFLIAEGREITPEHATSFIFVDALMNIVGDASAFIRGDTNRDGFLNISDPQATLSYLFLGQFSTTCLDAADANDDGSVDIADAIATLDFLFLGGPPPPPPNQLAGEDPTPDALQCFTAVD